MNGNETREEETLGNWAALSQWLNFQGFLLHCLSRATPFTKSPATWHRPTHSPTWHTAKPFQLFLQFFDALLLLSFPHFPLPAMPGLSWQWWSSWQEVEPTTWQTTPLITTPLLLLMFSPNFSCFCPISPIFGQFLQFSLTNCPIFYDHTPIS